MSSSNPTSSSRKAPAGAAPPRSAESSSSTVRRFSLDGPSVQLDPRLHACRSDIADVGLADRLFAPHYAEALVRACGVMPAMVRTGPSDGDEAVSELLPGEEFAVLDFTSGWAWGYCGLDHRVGYVEAIALTAPLEATHVVIEAQAPVQADPHPLTQTMSFLPMGSRLHGQVRGAVLEFEGGFIPLSHLRAVAEPEADPVAVAQRLMGALCLHGGRTLHGIDCSGLVQLSLQLCGIDCPRDAIDQRKLGEPVPDDAPLRRCDLLFCEEHVGMMVDDRMAIQVSPVAQKVTVEPFTCARPAGSAEGLERRRLRL